MASNAKILPFIVSRGDTSRMTVAEAHRFIHDVLMYLQALERAAELRNRRPLVLHYQQCWLTVCEACFGEDWSPSRVTLHTTSAAVLPGGDQRPRWFTEKYSRPMRRVVARVSRKQRARGRGDSYTIDYDVLSCGHMVEDHSATCGTAPAKHRRCEVCSSETSNKSRDTARHANSCACTPVRIRQGDGGKTC